MAVTLENNYTGNGSTTNYSITFEYIKEDDVKVSLDGTLTTAYSFANATTIEFTTAPGSDVAIRIYRDTDVDAQTSRFFAGSAIRAKDLNDNLNQSLFLVQEVKARTWDTETETIHSDETWVSSDTQIATTAAMDARFQDETNETITSTETWVSDDDHVATTAALDARFQDEISETITSTETWVENDDTVPTTLAASNQYDTLVQIATPSGTSYPVGKTWLQNDDDLTLSVWNGTGWTAITSGGTFTSLSKVVYVDAVNGNDDSEGHRISNPKQTIRAAVEQINAETDAVGNGSVVVVAPGIYAETFPIDIEKNDVSIVGTSLRNCIIHPAIPEADQADYDVNVPEANELSTMFRVNSGSYFQNLTLTGMKAGPANTRGDVGSLYEDATYGLPPNQGWNFAFLPNAVIRKSPYIQNCTNFSDSQINNVTFTPHTPGEGAAGDLDSAPSGGGILVDGSVPAVTSPLRSMVCDSYTHTALDGPGIFVTNNGYCQGTSSYAFFNHSHITAVNGGQANLAASTTDFGRYGLIADGRSTAAIFTSNVDGAADDGATTFNINQPAAGVGWFGDTQRPANNMLVEVNGNTYPILSATANTDSEGGDGWTVEISRPDPNNRSNNLGLNGALTDDAAVSFFLRSMIASSGHTMEYVGSGTNYNALPENGGVPTEANQKIELNDGKIWAATTDHNGKFTLGGNQTDDPFFEVDQQLGFVTIPEGSIAFNLLSDETPQLGGNLDVNDNVINNSGTGIVEFEADVVIDSTGYLQVPSGDTTARDALTGVNGMFRYNTTDNAFEGYANGAWGAIGGGGGGFEMATSPPASPSDGDTYWDTEEGLPYIYYEDGSSNQWVPLVPSTPPKSAEGGGTDEVFFLNDQAVTTNYEFPTGKNALSAGPITINSGVTVEIPNGQSWVIV